MRKEDHSRRPKPRTTPSRTDNWICLYSDGAVKVDYGDVVVGGITRDQHGNWILVFNRRLGQCSVFNAELWGILDGLFLLHSRRRIQQILLQTSLWEFEHILKEENAEAYDIAKLAFDKN
ncbi:hypothetical protein Gohar_016543, partial [Gossypium harknessii]|nr:hypothetical protein [Gossypium harknessii]